MTTAETSSRVSATTPTKPSVSRAWKVRGARRRNFFSRPRGRGLSALGECIADSAHGQHERRRRGVVLDLVAQVADVDIDRLLVLVERLVVAEQLEQLAARVDATRPAGQVTQDLELGGRK